MANVCKNVYISTLFSKGGSVSLSLFLSFSGFVHLSSSKKHFSNLPLESRYLASSALPDHYLTPTKEEIIKLEANRANNFGTDHAQTSLGLKFSSPELAL